MRASKTRLVVVALAAGASVTVLAACSGSGTDRPVRTATNTSGQAATSSATPAPTAPEAAASSSGSGATSGATSSAPAEVVRRDGLAVPDPDATPGSALAGVTRAQICTEKWASEHNTIGYAVQNQVSAHYAVVAGKGTSLHLDQLIPASLGGDVTAANVWPQPQSEQKTKNGLEGRLHQLVCTGDLSLAAAQDAIARDWPAALRKYSAS